VRGKVIRYQEGREADQTANDQPKSKLISNAMFTLIIIKPPYFAPAHSVKPKVRDMVDNCQVYQIALMDTNYNGAGTPHVWL
jgi:hypothetical protein